MTNENTQSDWAALKGKIKTRFAKLSDDHIDSMKGNLELLSGKLQTAYGYGKEQADKEFAGFKATLNAASAPQLVKTPEKEAAPKPLN